MELASLLSQQLASDTQPIKEKNILNVMDKSTPGQNLSQQLKITIKHFKIAITFLYDYSGIFKFQYKKNSISQHQFLVKMVLSK